MGTTRCAYPCRWVWSLVLGKDRLGRVTTDTARAASVFVVCRLSFVVRLCRLSFGPPTLGFGLWVFSLFWFLAGECGCVPAHTAHAQTRPSCDGTGSVQRRFKGPGYLLAWLGGGGGRPGRIALGPRSVLVPWGFVVVLCVESQESGVESQVTSPSQATLRGPTSYIYMMHRI